MFHDTNRGKIVEKSWKTSELRISVQSAQSKKGATRKNTFHRAIAENLLHIMACSQALRWETGMIALPFRDFPRFFHDLRLKTAFLPLLLRVRSLPKRNPKRAGYIATVQPAHHLHGQLTCDTVFRATPPLSTEDQPPKAGGDTSVRTAPLRNRSLQEFRRPVHHVHAERPDNPASRHSHRLPADWNEQRKFLGLPVKDYAAG